MAEGLGQAIGSIVGAWKSVSARKILQGTPTLRTPTTGTATPSIPTPGIPTLGTATTLGRFPINPPGGGRRPGKRHVWQVDYYDRFIRNEQHYRAAADYIHQNPVKAGLVARAQDWPWSSIRFAEREWPGSL